MRRRLYPFQIVLVPTGQETEVARLTRELNEAQEQQKATTDVLRVVSRSAFDLQALFAARTCSLRLALKFRGKRDTLSLTRKTR